MPQFTKNDESTIIDLTIKARKWPSSFYGIGNNTLEDDEEKYVPIQYEAELEYKQKVAEHLYLSGIAQIIDTRMTHLDSEGELAKKTIPGSEKNMLTGVGAAVTLDKRDDKNYSTSGYYLSFRSVKFTDALGSDYNLFKSELDVRQFIDLPHQQVLAFQGLFRWVTGNPAFKILPDLGNNIRGYDSGRFIDNYLSVIKTEYKVFPWKEGFLRRVGFVAFAEFGQVASEINAIRMKETKCAFGFGTRFLILPESKLSLRFEFGFGKDSTDMIFTAREEF